MREITCASNFGSVHYDASQDSWDWAIHEIPILMGVKSQIKIEGGDGLKMISHAVEPFEDSVGKGSRLQLNYSTAEGVFFDISLFSYDDAPLLAIEGSVTNDSVNDVRLQGIVLVDGSLFLGESSVAYSVLSNGYWMGGCRLVFLDKEAGVTSFWDSAITNRSSGKSLVTGIASAANVDDAITFRKAEDVYNFRFTGHCASDRKGRPLLLKAGRSFSMNRIVLVYADDIHAGLEQYSSYVTTYANIAPRHKPYVGLFTGYSSDPGNQTVIRLTEARVLEQLDILERTVQKYGVEYIKIEFGVCGSPGLLEPEMADVGEPGYVQPREYHVEQYFPKGIRALTDEIHKRGFKAALQSRTFLYVKGGAPDEVERTTAIYKRAKEEWGFDYFMLDFNSSDSSNSDETRTYASVLRDRFRTIRDAVGDDIFIEACMMAIGPVLGTADGYRPAGDYRGGNENSLLLDFTCRHYYHGKLLQLDTEFYDACMRPFVWHSQPVITPIEGTRTWISMCALLGYSFLLGGDLRNTSAERFHILSRALPVSGICAKPIGLMEEELPKVWVLDTDGNLPAPRRARQAGACVDKVIGLFNWSYDEIDFFRLDFDKCGLKLDKTYTFFDFWRKKFLGEFQSPSPLFSTQLPPRNCLILHVQEIEDKPAIIGTDRHVTSAYAVETFEWDEENLTVKGTSSGPEGTSHSLFVYIPQKLGPKSWKNCRCDLLEEKVLEVELSFDARQKVEWTVTLDSEAIVR
jgi:hypothetical protein